MVAGFGGDQTADVRRQWRKQSVSKRKTSTRSSGRSTKRSSRGPLAGAGLGDIVDSGQQLLSGAQDRATDAVKSAQKLAAETLNALERRRDAEIKNLRALVREVNANLGGLERRYRALEKNLTKQIETLSGRTVKASDLDRRIRALESEILRAVGQGRSAAKKATSTAKRSPAPRTTAARRSSAPARRTAAKKTTSPARKTTTAKKTTSAATKTARTATRRATGAAKAIGVAFAPTTFGYIT